MRENKYKSFPNFIMERFIDNKQSRKIDNKLALETKSRIN